jgi:hypothetical protein
MISRVQYILSCLLHQTTKQPILFSPIFSSNFFSVEKENKLFIGPKFLKKLFWTNKKFVFVSTTQPEKNSGQKLGKIWSTELLNDPLSINHNF